MLSSIEITDYEFKKGIGYSQKSVDEFIAKVAKDYDELLKENIELKDKASALSEGLQYYKSIEKTLQKALVLAQKASDEEQAQASRKAKNIEREAHTRAGEVLSKAKSDLDTIFRQTDELNRRFELYKAHVKNLITTQLDLINSDAYNISVNDLEGYLKLKDALGGTEEINSEKAPEKEDIESEIQADDEQNNFAEAEKEESFVKGEKEEAKPEKTEDNAAESKASDNLISRIPDDTAAKEGTEVNLNTDDNEGIAKRRIRINRYRNGESGYEQNTYD